MHLSPVPGGPPCRRALGRLTPLSDLAYRPGTVRWTLALPLFLFACTSGPDPLSGPNTVDPTFHRDIEPLLQKRCQNCHHEGGIGPMPLTAYDSAKLFAPSIARVTAARTMPPWGASSTDECQVQHAYRDDQSLSADEIAMLAKWNELGAPKGDPAAAPKARTMFDAPIVRDPTISMTPEQGWVPTGRQDQYRCFVLDPKVGIPTFVQSVGFRPGNPAVVHHAIVFTDPGRDSPKKVDESGSYECFGSPGLDDTQILYAWAPGVEPTDLGTQFGYYVPANALLVLQIHYHPSGEPGAPDRSSVDLKFSENLPPYAAFLGLIGNFNRTDRDGNGLLAGDDDTDGKVEFRIPANKAGHVERMKYTLPARFGDFVVPEFRLLTVGAHMHYVGRDMLMEIERQAPGQGQPAKECVLQTPQWNFNWQRAYTFDEPVERAPTIKPGDTLHLRCTYDNTMQNPFVAKALSEQALTEPHDVFLGESTLDEMCLGALVLAFPNPLK